MSEPADRDDLAAALREVSAAARHWIRCLRVEAEGVGRCDPRAIRAAQRRYQEAVAAIEPAAAPERLPSP